MIFQWKGRKYFVCSSILISLKKECSMKFHKILQTALSTWTDVVCLTLGDKSLSEEHQTNNVWLGKQDFLFPDSDNVILYIYIYMFSKCVILLLCDAYFSSTLQQTRLN